MESRLDSRKKAFKKRPDDPRKRREELQLSLRKQQREQELQKRRVAGDDTAANKASMDVMSSNQNRDVSVIPQLVNQIMSDNVNEQFEATQAFRRLLSIEHSPPIQEVLNANVTPRLIEFLKNNEAPTLQFEAAWALTNIASGTQDQTGAVVEQGGVPIFVDLLRSPHAEVREQAVWALGNISGDSPACRDIVLYYGGLQGILQQLNPSSKESMIRNATWAISNLCRGKPPPAFASVSPCLPILCELIQSNDIEVLTDACWALSYLSDGVNVKIQAVLDANVLPHLVELLAHPSTLVQTPALRTVGNIVTGNDQQTQEVLNHGALGYLKNLLSSSKRIIRKETCWAVSNIAAGSQEQLQAIIDSGMVPKIVELVAKAEFEIKKEAAWTISNAASGGNPAQVEEFVRCGCIEPLCGLLELSDMKLVIVALEALDHILRIGNIKKTEENLAENPYISLVEHADGVKTLERLQDVNNEEVCDKAYRLIFNFFPCEEEIDNTTLQPENLSFSFGTDTTPGTFHFGTGLPTSTQHH